MCDLDDGEAESLAYLFSKADDYLICSGDAIVYRVLGNTSRGEQGISLEEILAKTGFTKDVSWPYDKKFRVQHSDQGGVDLIQNRGRL